MSNAMNDGSSSNNDSNNSSTNKYIVLAVWSRRAVWLSYFGLIAVLSLIILVWPSCNREPSPVIWAIQVGILACFLPGMIKQHVRTHAWLAFILMGYFMGSVSTVFACASTLLVAEVVLTVLLFIAATLYIRWRSKQLAFNDQASME